MSIALFLLLMAAIAGLVAAGGDWVGHRAARRKIRIGGLRPRHASTLIAVMTGVVIALATYGIVLAVWRDAREALTSYGRVKADLATATRELSQMQGRLDEAEQRVADADQLVADAEAEAQEARDQLGGIRGQIIDLAIDLDKTNQELEKLQAQVLKADKALKDKKAEADSEQFRVNSLIALKDKLGSEIEELEERIAQMQEGDILLDRGTYLAYQRVGAGQAAQLAEVLQGALNKVNMNLTRDGLKIDTRSAARAENFISSFSHAGETLVIISSAQNVFEGEDVLLEFEARPLEPLASAGATAIEVTIERNQAELKVLGLLQGSLPAPASLEGDALSQFIDALQQRVAVAALEVGFLPNLGTGRVSLPVSSLNSRSAELSGSGRPLVISFVANNNLTALDGLGDCSIKISGPAAE